MYLIPSSLFHQEFVKWLIDISLDDGWVHLDLLNRRCVSGIEKLLEIFLELFDNTCSWDHPLPTQAVLTEHNFSLLRHWTVWIKFLKLPYSPSSWSNLILPRLVFFCLQDSPVGSYFGLWVPAHCFKCSMGQDFPDRGLGQTFPINCLEDPIYLGLPGLSNFLPTRRSNSPTGGGWEPSPSLSQVSNIWPEIISLWFSSAMRTDGHSWLNLILVLLSICYIDLLWQTQKSNNWWERAALPESNIHWKQFWLTYCWQCKPCSFCSYREPKEPLVSTTKGHGTDTHGYPHRIPWGLNAFSRGTKHILTGWANSHDPSSTLEGMALVHCSALGWKPHCPSWILNSLMGILLLEHGLWYRQAVTSIEVQ